MPDLGKSGTSRISCFRFSIRFCYSIATLCVELRWARCETETVPPGPAKSDLAFREIEVRMKTPAAEGAMWGTWAHHQTMRCRLNQRARSSNLFCYSDRFSSVTEIY